MNDDPLKRAAKGLLDGELTQAGFLCAVSTLQHAHLVHATLDLDRRRRCGFPEVVFGSGKTADQVGQIIACLLETEREVLATRISHEQAESLQESFPHARYNRVARTLRVSSPGEQTTDASSAGRSVAAAGYVAIVTAGTSDVPVAEEARETLEWMGVGVTMIHDVGVAGPHRLPAHLEVLERADAVVVVAGMEGALPSVVGGYVACPVVAVPTSIGYGASFQWIAALLGMLNSCAANVTVVNIDAGFKGAYVAGLIALGKSKKDP